MTLYDVLDWDTKGWPVRRTKDWFMTPAEIRASRQSLGLSQTGLAEALRLGPNGERTIRRWEAGDIPVTGPASVAIELLVAQRIEARSDETPQEVRPEGQEPGPKDAPDS